MSEKAETPTSIGLIQAIHPSMLSKKKLEELVYTLQQACWFDEETENWTPNRCYNVAVLANALVTTLTTYGLRPQDLTGTKPQYCPVCGKLHNESKIDAGVDIPIVIFFGCSSGHKWTAKFPRSYAVAITEGVELE